MTAVDESRGHPHFSSVHFINKYDPDPILVQLHDLLGPFLPLHCIIPHRYISQVFCVQLQRTVTGLRSLTHNMQKMALSAMKLTVTLLITMVLCSSLGKFHELKK